MSEGRISGVPVGCSKTRKNCRVVLLRDLTRQVESLTEIEDMGRGSRKITRETLSVVRQSF